MMDILFAMLIVGVVGLILGILLCIAAVKFKVETDPREEEILAVLPGSNCGGCGFAGCAQAAQAIAAGNAPANACPVGGAAVAEKVAAIMGTTAQVEKKTAFVKCAGTCQLAKERFLYEGNPSCLDASYVGSGGPKACTYGCLGFGSCVSACPFDAIAIRDGVAVVDPETCVACGKCVAACPKGLIELVPYEKKVRVACSSRDGGKQVKLVCQTGCIGCKICQKNCPEGAISVENNLAHIDYEKCTGCGLCEQKCPVKIIRRMV